MDKNKYLKTNKLFSIAVFVLALAMMAFIFYRFFPPLENDWMRFYSKLTANLSYPNHVPGYVNPPWAALLVPYGLLPIRISNVINLLLNIAVLFFAIRKVNGGWLGILLTFTSPLFFDLARVNPIDWIPLLGFLLPTAWGLPLMAIKPQTLGASMLIKWKNENYKIKPLIPLIVVVILSFLVWGFWINKEAVSFTNKPWNFSFWPLSIPLGIYVLYKAWKEGDELLTGASTALLVPYIAPYSIACIISILSGKYKKIAIALYLISWWYVMVEGRRLGLIMF